MLSAEAAAETRRQDGNAYFRREKFAAAIDAYTEAFTLCPDVAVYWTNRALCHRKRNEWTRVEEDCRRAIELDHGSVKAYYLLGLSLLEKQEFSGGVKELEKALDLGRGANPELYMVDKIWEALAKAKHMKWEHESVERSWELQMLKEACETALEVKHAIDISQIEGPIDEAVKSISEQFAALDRVFDKAAEADIPTEVPDYLCCRISLDILRDPVITPSGFTYERAVILDHLQKVGDFDPITREPLDPSQLISNYAIKEAVDAYLAKHGWAYG
ncbi:E3 ubiquitin-protein ligase CHIP-like protein [Drosera capensis]